MTSVAPVHGFVTRPGVSWNRFNFSSVIDLQKPRNDTWGRGRESYMQSTTSSVSNRISAWAKRFTNFGRLLPVCPVIQDQWQTARESHGIVANDLSDDLNSSTWCDSVRLRRPRGLPVMTRSGPSIIMKSPLCSATICLRIRRIVKRVLSVLRMPFSGRKRLTKDNERFVTKGVLGKFLRSLERSES
jgi:hypothetical protein